MDETQNSNGKLFLHSNTSSVSSTNAHHLNNPNGDDINELNYWDSELVDPNLKVSKIIEASNYIRDAIQSQSPPQVAIICGSGISHIGSELESQSENSPVTTISYDEIPNFPRSTVKGHGNSCVAGLLNSIPVLVFKGRFHFYEGHSMNNVVLIIRVIAALGIKRLLLTNAAGALNGSYNVGDLMVINDHISFPALAGINPLRGKNIPEIGTRFPPTTHAYHKDSYKLVSMATSKLNFNFTLHSGVYVNVGGPSYETAAECRFLKLIGGDVVGMSTAPEVIAAVHAGIKGLIAISQVTNKCILEIEDVQEQPKHQDVLAVSRKNESQLSTLISELVKLMATEMAVD